MNKNKAFDSLAVISTIGILAWMITDYFGGMILYLFSYGIVILPLIVLYIVSFFNTIISVIKTGYKINKIKVSAHTLLILIIIAINVFNSEIFKSKSLFKAILKDDQYNYSLIFRENGKCENIVNGIFGFNTIYKGIYKLKGDTIIFETKPYDNNFIPDTLLLDKKAAAIFILKDSAGNFSNKKEWLNHFDIIK